MIPGETRPKGFKIREIRLPENIPTLPLEDPPSAGGLPGAPSA